MGRPAGAERCAAWFPRRPAHDRYRTRIYGDAQLARIPYDRTAVPVRT